MSNEQNQSNQNALRLTEAAYLNKVEQVAQFIPLCSSEDLNKKYILNYKTGSYENVGESSLEVTPLEAVVIGVYNFNGCFDLLDTNSTNLVANTRAIIELLLSHGAKTEEGNGFFQEIRDCLAGDLQYYKYEASAASSILEVMDVESQQMFLGELKAFDLFD